MKLILGATVLITALGISTVNANPMGNCGPLDKAMEYLNRKHGETLKFTGISGSGYMIMMFYNEETAASMAWKFSELMAMIASYTAAPSIATNI